MQGFCKNSAVAISAVVGVWLSATAAIAQQSGQPVAGTLTCEAKGTVGLIVGSKQALSCAFTPTKGALQNYAGTLTKVGIDLGIRGASTMVWTVLFSSGAVPAGALAGQYGGISADASVGVGGGANILVGGSKNSVSLQPLSVQGQAGLNVAAGVSGLTLEHVR
jgi:hypothetical protein